MEDVPSIDVTAVRNGDDALVTVVGDLDHATQPAFIDGVVDAVRVPGAHRVAVDLTGVGFIDSAGISALLHGRERAHSHGVSLEVVAESTVVRQVLELMGLLQIMRRDG